MLNALRISLTLAAATAAPLAAQDFSAGVQQDPRAGTAIYDFHFSGPPRGQALIAMGSLGVQLTLPPLGNLYLDPNAPMLLGPAVPLDASGIGRWRITLPLTDNNATMAFQAVFIDPAQNVRLSQRWLAITNAAVPRTPFGYLFVYDAPPKRLNLFARGRPGTSVRFRVRRGGKLIADKVAKIGPGGTVSAQMPADVGPGDSWSIVYSDPKNMLGIGRGGKF